MRVALHHPNDLPKVNEYGMNLAPSTFTDIGITEVFIDCICT